MLKPWTLIYHLYLFSIRNIICTNYIYIYIYIIYYTLIYSSDMKTIYMHGVANQGCTLS